MNRSFHFDRRDFLAGATGLTASSMLASVGNSAEDKIEIVDTHQHLWDLSKFRLDWLKGADDINRSFVMKDYLAATDGLNVHKAVYMEVDVVQEQKAAEAEYVIEICERKEAPTVAAVIGANLLDKGFEAYALRFAASSSIKGVRHLLATESGGKTCADDSFIKQIRLLGQLKLRFDLCMRPDQLDAGAKLAETVPETQFVLDHCGNADVMAFAPENKRTRKADHDLETWRKGISAIAKQKNVICKLSGIIARVTKGAWAPKDLQPIIDHCIESFGIDRVMFASDWPVCLLGAELREWVHALKELTAPYGQEGQQKIFHRNAVRFYGLS